MDSASTPRYPGSEMSPRGFTYPDPVTTKKVRLGVTTGDSTTLMCLGFCLHSTDESSVLRTDKNVQTGSDGNYVERDKNQ